MNEKHSVVSKTLCGIDDIEQCPYFIDEVCVKFGRCRIREKSDDQVEYILSPIDSCIYLEACAGSGKTEVLGMKAAYEICRWESKNTGIAVLSFTNDAVATITNRINTFYRRPIPSNHFVGTFSSFVHGYIAQKFGYYFYRGEVTCEDKSFHIIASDKTQYESKWLSNFALNYQFKEHAPEVYASQLNYHSGVKGWGFTFGDQFIEVIKYCKSDAQKQLLQKRIKECKLKFWEHGFATFEDMNYIALKCLSQTAISSILAKRFPLILIDECQDLSQNELNIISRLISSGTKVHYIGDLNQSIYSFKDSLPQYILDHMRQYDFSKLFLRDNYRSTQSIVNVSRAIVEIDSPIVGKKHSMFSGDDCYYIEYSNEAEAIDLFEQLLRKRGIPISNAVVLVRTQDAKSKMAGITSTDYSTNLVVHAIQYWNRKSIGDMQLAMNLLGRQLQKWMGFQGQANRFYYSPDICKSPVTWRIMLQNILDAFNVVFPINNMEGKTYSAWLTESKRQIVSIVNAHLYDVVGKTLNENASFIRSSNGTALNKIKPIRQNESNMVKIETIHAVKGATYDAVLLLSSPDKRGKTGYWKSWIEGNDENARICYVACTRPRILLCWGVKELINKEDRQMIERIGLKKYKTSKG